MKISYREQFIKNVKQLFKTETAAYLRKEKAEELIYDYVNELMEYLYDESEAATEKFDLDYDKIKLRGIELALNLCPVPLRFTSRLKAQAKKT